MDMSSGMEIRMVATPPTEEEGPEAATKYVLFYLGHPDAKGRLDWGRKPRLVHVLKDCTGYYAMSSAMAGGVALVPEGHVSLDGQGDDELRIYHKVVCGLGEGFSWVMTGLVEWE